MKFCVISPIAGLERYATQSTTHLVLAQHLYNQKYMDFYSKRKAAGDFIILDNGAYENTKPLDNEAYFNYIRDLSPNVVVLPDILMSPWRKTTSVALNFLDKYATHPLLKHYKIEWMFVPQTVRATDSLELNSPLNDWLNGLTKVIDDGRVGHLVTWVGLGRYLATEFINLPGKPHRRAQLVDTVKRHMGFGHLKFHALGKVDDLAELRALADAGVESIDSSAPVWRGWGGIDIRDPLWKTIGSPCDFYTQEEPNHNVIQSNLEVIFNAIR